MEQRSPMQARRSSRRWLRVSEAGQGLIPVLQSEDAMRYLPGEGRGLALAVVYREKALIRSS